MPPEIPPMCGVLTCDHEGPGNLCKLHSTSFYDTRHDGLEWFCQQPLGACLIHDKPYYSAGEAIEVNPEHVDLVWDLNHPILLRHDKEEAE